MKIKASVEVDNTDIQQKIDTLKMFFNPGGPAHRILEEEALKTRDKIRMDVFRGQRHITGEGRSPMKKTQTYASLFKHKVTYNTKKQEIFLGMYGIPTKQVFHKRYLYTLNQASQLNDSIFNKLNTSTSVAANKESTLRVPSALASIHAKEMLNKNERLKQIPNDEDYFVARPNQLKGSSIVKKYGNKGNSPIAFKRDKKNKKLIPIGIFYDKAKYDNSKAYKTPKVENHINKMINIIKTKIMNKVKQILGS